MAELVQLQETISHDPASQNRAGGIFLYTPAARKKLDTIARAITSLLAEKRLATGRPVPCAGYSGRGTNRR